MNTSCWGKYLAVWAVAGLSSLAAIVADDHVLRTTDPRLAADRFIDHVRELRRSIDTDRFTIVIQPPFVVIGDEAPEVVRQRSEQTVQWAVEHLKRLYFQRDGEHIINIWLFRDRESYESHCWEFFQRRPHTPYGFYSRQDRALVMNIATGGGTLVHEIVHPFIEANFPDCPAWFNEGLASLYEQSREQDGRIRGLTNWRLRGLQTAIVDDRLGSLEDLLATTTREFYDDRTGQNYAQARYLCYYLQEHGKLTDFYHQFARDARRDPTGRGTLQAILEIDDLAAFEESWRAFVMQLRF